MIAAALLAVAAWNRWLLTFSVSAVLVLVLGAYARTLARRTPKPAERTSRREFRQGGVRRRAGGLIALGPLLGLAVGPALGKEAILVGLGTAVIAVFGMIIERSDHVSGLALIGVGGAALAAVLTGLELGPTGVPALDVIGAFVFVFAVMKSIDGLGNVDGLVAEAGSAAALPLFAIAGFAGQVGLATVFDGLTATCLAFLAFNLRPASLFMGRGGRLAVGFALSTGALAVHPVPADGRTLAVPMILLALFWFDALVVVLDRA